MDLPLHYVEIENFKRFRSVHRIELGHPAVLVGPNNSGKTSVIQAVALWSHAVKSWWDEKGRTEAKERKGRELNRLAITSVPVLRTRHFWNDAKIHTGRVVVSLSIAAGVEWKGEVVPVRMKFRHQGDDLLYCVPDEAALSNIELLEQAARIGVHLLYPMSGLTTEEPLLRPGRIEVLLGQGDTAQVLRNLCLSVHAGAKEDWDRVRSHMKRLFGVTLGEPKETARGAIELTYEQDGFRGPLDLSLAGRGFQQILLLCAYLYSHKGSVLLIDEPDAHLEILRQRQIYVLLRDAAAENGSQVVLATHSETVLEEAVDGSLSFLLEGKVERPAANDPRVRNSLKHYGARHYLTARARGYVLYLEGGTDLDMLHGFARVLKHPILEHWDERPNVYYVQDNYPDRTMEAELERVEGGYGITPEKHFHGLRGMLRDLSGLALLDNDGKGRESRVQGDLEIVYWRRYEAENYFVTPDLLVRFCEDHLRDQPLLHGRIGEVMDERIREEVFGGSVSDFESYRAARSESPRAAALLWDAKTERIKLSDFAERFFRALRDELRIPLLLRKGGLHRLIEYADPASFAPEVSEKLDRLQLLFERGREYRAREYGGTT